MKASNAISNRNAPPTSQPRTAGSSFSTAERFTLSGPSIVLDPAIHAYRNDLADVALAGQLFAPHYVRPVKRMCGPAPAPVRAEPSADSALLFDLVPDEEFAVLDVTAGWAWGYRRSDHRVGYVRAEQLLRA